MDYSKFHTIQRQIFGICPECNDFFRLSDCKIFSKEKPVPDWKDNIETELEKLSTLEQTIREKENEIRQKAREEGRRRAQQLVKKIDPIFAPKDLNPDDAKVIFHPIDYIVFNGMNSGALMKNIILLDRQTKEKEQKKTQQSIQRVIDRENYCWQTIRVCDDGKICVE